MTRGSNFEHSCPSTCHLLMTARGIFFCATRKYFSRMFVAQQFLLRHNFCCASKNNIIINTNLNLKQFFIVKMNWFETMPAFFVNCFRNNLWHPSIDVVVAGHCQPIPPENSTVFPFAFQRSLFFFFPVVFLVFFGPFFFSPPPSAVLLYVVAFLFLDP